jgi:hypothetical protein
VLGALGHTYALSGQRTEALQVLDRSRDLSGQTYVSSNAVALVHAGIGEQARALEWLRKACRERARHLVYLKLDPELYPLGDNPRFRDLLRRMKFPGERPEGRLTKRPAAR